MREIIRPFFATVVVGIDADLEKCRVYTSYYKFKKLTGYESKNFETQAGEVPQDAIRYVKKIKAANPFTYTSVFTQTLVQGVLPTTKVKDFQKYGINADTINYFSAKTCTFYIAQNAIAEAKQTFEKLGGIDFLFSPFALLYELAKPKFDNTPRLYALLKQSSVTMIVARENVLFGAFFLLSGDLTAPNGTQEIKIPAKSKKQDKSKEESDLEVLDNASKEIDSLGADLDSLDDSLLDSLEGDSAHPHADTAKTEDFSISKEGFGDFSRISKAATYIQQGLNEYYTSQIYESEFVNEIYLFDGNDYSPDVLEHIKTITLLELQVFPCDIAQGISLLGFQALSTGNRRR